MQVFKQLLNDYKECLLNGDYLEHFEANKKPTTPKEPAA